MFRGTICDDYWTRSDDADVASCRALRYRRDPFVVLSQPGRRQRGGARPAAHHIGASPDYCGLLDQTEWEAGEQDVGSRFVQ